VTPESLPLPLGSSCRAISNAVGPDGRGRPDIIAWRKGSIAGAVFVELKMKDAIHPDQEMWFRAAKNAGVSHNQCAIARWRKIKGVALSPVP
jgi:hypothetical protein